ncbi:sensor histidine kinase [Isoptericola croceus]|uniref:sensor histidine kinase n=1 Tax=Isoptericola croceus TaxID=3031406 RepID=UPI0023F75405|nr:histidine kinase [Isoptericola croceus]
MPTPPDDPYRVDAAAAAGPSVPDRRPAVPTRSRLRHLWGETWRLGVALSMSMLITGGVVYESETGQRQIEPERIALDIVIGLVCLGLVLLRRRAPMTIALIVTAAGAVSVFAAGPTALAVLSLATHRSWWRIAVVGVEFVVAGWVYGVLYPAADSLGWLVDVGVGLLLYALLVWIGAYIGLRREHLAGLHGRLATAEREQASRVAQARANERARIAREMHDVLAHRMSLVAMHAGALAYRTDLPREQVAESAALVRDSAHEALGELREVLGVLRGLDGPGPDEDAGLAPDPERPQPTLADLPALTSSTTEAGTSVRLVDRTTSPDRLPTATSRTAYRIVQEALTNVRKHARELPASVELRGAPGEGMWITVTNPTASSGGSGPRTEVGRTPAAGDVEPMVPPSGLGLLGLTERAELAGGTLTARETDGRFVLRAWLPWAA